MFYSSVAPADHVQEGQVLGVMRDFGGAELGVVVRFSVQFYVGRIDAPSLLCRVTATFPA
jgi:hypothetical protein